MTDPGDLRQTLKLALAQSQSTARCRAPGYPLDRYFRDLELAAPANLVDLVVVDQQQRWLDKERRPLEDYLHRFPVLADDSQQLLDLVYHEYLLQESLELLPRFDAFAARFPDLSASLRQLIDFHLALELMEDAAAEDEGEEGDPTAAVVPVGGPGAAGQPYRVEVVNRVPRVFLSIIREQFRLMQQWMEPLTSISQQNRAGLEALQKKLDEATQRYDELMGELEE